MIDDEGQARGKVPRDEALKIAREKELDLVEVGPTANPPVCKILDYGKFRYEQEKKQQKGTAKGHSGEIKEIRLRVKTDEHDFQTKINLARKFLEKGYKIRVTVNMKGRENIYANRALAQIERVKNDLALETEQPPQRFGTRFITTLVKANPKSNA